MRAAASQSMPKTKRPEAETQADVEHHEIAATGTRGISELGRRGIVKPATGGAGARKVASARDGERSPQILALSQLGRSRS